MEGLQRAFILHSRLYSETSLILDVFSENEGRVSIMAKGVRASRSKLKGLLQPFTPLLLKWSAKGGMGVLRHAEPLSLAIPLSGSALYSALYLNEMLIRVLAEKSPYPELFFSYIRALTKLAKKQEIEPALREFELTLLEALGYGIDFLHCAASGAAVESEMHYLFQEQHGFCASLRRSPQFSFSGSELKAMASREFNTIDELKAAKRFTRMALKPYLGSKPLKSRELFLLKKQGKCLNE